MCLVSTGKGGAGAKAWHSVGYRLGPDERATLVDLEKEKWAAGDWHASRMGVENDESL